MEKPRASRDRAVSFGDRELELFIVVNMGIRTFYMTRFPSFPVTMIPRNNSKLQFFIMLVSTVPPNAYKLVVVLNISLL